MTGRALTAVGRLAAALALGLAGASLAAQEVPRLRLAPCEIPGVEGPAECGTLTVWENREAGAGRTLDLYTVLLLPTDPDPRPDPIYVLTGGPGSAASGSAPGWSRGDRRHSRAIVLMDQRGTGRNGGLECLHPPEAPVDVYLGQIFDPDLIADCAARLGGERDLTRYTSPASLDDLEDLRVALGHERINLFGTSYGTRAALVYLRRHGEHARSAVLQASMAMSQVMPEHMARDAEAAVRGVIADCLAMETCAAAYPRLEEEYRVAVERAREPVPVTLRDPRTGESVESVLRPAGFGEALRAMMYGPGPTRDIPRLLHLAATEGDFDGFAQFGAARSYQIARAASTGMYLSVTCAEDIPFADEAAEYERGAGTFLADSRARSHFEACRRWPRGRVPDDLHEEVASDVPVLILNGEHDPVTPPRWGEAAARELSNAFRIVVPHGGHGWGGLENADCVTAIEDAFLERPGTAPEASCLASIRRRPFR